MTRKSLFTLSVLLALVPGTGHAGPLTQDACAGSVTVSVFKTLGNDVLENLLFYEGSLWVSDGTAGAVRRFGADGSEGTGLTGVASPGGLSVGPDERIYAGVGNSIANAVTKSGAAKVVRFEASDPAGTVADYASGFNMANGMTWGPANGLFVSNDFDKGLIRIPRNPDGTAGAWALYTDVWGTNGLVVVGNDLYAAITFDQRSPIERISLVPPTAGDHETAVQLSVGVVSLEPNVYTDPNLDAPLLGVKGLDDMTRDADGNLYPVANGMGELLRVDPDDPSSACLITGGLQNPSSVRIAPESSAFADGDADTMDFYVTQFDGRIMKVVFDPA